MDWSWLWDWESLWNQIVKFFETNGWHILTFFGVLFGGIIAIKLTLNITRRILNRTSMEKIAVGFIVAILKFVLYLILVINLLQIIGVEITGIVTAFSAVALSVGLALQSNIANVANGIIIVSSSMFKKGDYIEVDGVEGSITQINFLYVTILTRDNKRVTIPNSKILDGVVTNYDSNNTRRVNFTFEVAYSNDVEKVKKVVIDCMKSNGLVRLDPAPFCRLSEMGDSNLVFTARCWCDREDYWTVYYDMMELVFNEFKRNDINIDYNQVEMRERKDKIKAPINGKGLPERQEKVRQWKWHLDLENGRISDLFPVRAKKTKAQKKAEKLAAKQAAKAEAEAQKTQAAADKAAAVAEAKQRAAEAKASKQASKQATKEAKESAKVVLNATPKKEVKPVVKKTAVKPAPKAETKPEPKNTKKDKPKK